MRCQYNKCQAVGEYETSFGTLCPYHFKVLNKKKGLKGIKIPLSKAEKKLMKKFILMPNVKLNYRRQK